MKQTIFLLFPFFLSSCYEINDIKLSNQTQIQIDTTILKNDTSKVKKELTMFEWENLEDSLRNQILIQKENKLVKESFLQEFYIRNVLTISNDSLIISIPFDIHGPDCSAPDCYSTDVIFKIYFKEEFKFPDIIQIQEYEHGCVDKEVRLSSNFQLVDKNDKTVIYNSSKLKRTLVLFNSNKENGTSAYYFKGLSKNKINTKNITKQIEENDEDNENSIYPFKSWILTTNEYENFLK